MPNTPNPNARVAAQGERLIEVRIRFHTAQLAGQEGSVIPKHAWDSGFVLMASNKTHGVVPENPIPFNSIMQMTAIIEKVLIQHGIVLHPNNRSSKYIQTEP